MSGLLKNILIVLMVLAIGAWIFTVAKSCKKQDPTTTITENHITADGNSSETEENLDELYDEADGEGDGETDGEMDESDDLTSESLSDEDSDEGEDEGMDEDEDLLDENEDNSGENGSAANNGSNYRQPHLVVAGSYLSEVNAKILLKKLKNSGYNDAEIVVFDFSQYHTVCAGRFASSREAHALKRKLINQENVPEAYVHTKRPRKK